MKKFISGMRDKTALFFTWLLIIWSMYYLLSKQVDISLMTIWQLLGISFSMAFIFNAVFTTKCFEKICFTVKLTIFIFSCTLMESFLIYQFGFYGISTMKQWIAFFVVVALLYGASIGVFQIYRIKASREYTKLLKQYQQAKRDKIA